MTGEECIFYNQGRHCVFQRPAVFAGMKPVDCPCEHHYKEEQKCPSCGAMLRTTITYTNGYQVKDVCPEGRTTGCPG